MPQNGDSLEVQIFSLSPNSKGRLASRQLVASGIMQSNMMRLDTPVRTPQAPSRLSSVFTRQSSVAPLRVGAHRRATIVTARHKPVPAQAAASFSSGGGNASFDRPGESADEKSAADGKAKAAKVATYVFLW